MNRAETTKFLGQLLINTRFGGAGKHWASEVSIDPWGQEAKRVDYMQFSPADQCSISGIEKGIFTCYEIKSCKEDSYGPNAGGTTGAWKNSTMRSISMAGPGRKQDGRT